MNEVEIPHNSVPRYFNTEDSTAGRDLQESVGKDQILIARDGLLLSARFHAEQITSSARITQDDRVVSRQTAHIHHAQLVTDMTFLASFPGIMDC